ncbi:MAG: uroporphyrinogen-III C-methyltransferase [Opitutales bacterium]
MGKKSGKVFLTGAGPGDPGLITVRARELLEKADAVVYDYLVHPGLLDCCRSDCEKIYVGKKAGFHSVPQAEIEHILVKKAKAGMEVVRLKGGDPFIYGRGGEEALTLARDGIAFEIVPGITAAVAASCYAGIPLTHRNTSSSVIFLTGHEDPEKKKLAVNWRDFAQLDATLCIYMGMGRLKEIVSELLAGGMKPGTPAAVVQWASLPRQRSLISSVGNLIDEVAERDLTAPAIVMIGEVAEGMEALRWFENRPLFGRRVVVTRNREQAGALREKLEALGAEVLEIPLVEVSEDRHPETADDVFSEFWSFEWIVFSSANGVRYFFDEFFRRFSDIRSIGGIRFAVIGAATAREIESHRIAVELVAEESTAEGLAKALVATESLDNAKVLVVTGNRNRKVLVESLQNAMAIVDELPVYKTELASLGDNPVVKDFRENGADLIVFTSSSAVASFVAQAKSLKLAPNTVPPKAASLGPITSEKLKGQGISVAVEATEQNLDSLVEGIVGFFQPKPELPPS